MQAIGIIIGHGYGKAVCRDRHVVFPSVAAPAGEEAYESALRRGPQTVSLNGKGRWIVGADALAFAPQRLVSILDRKRYDNPSFQALASYAFSQVISTPGDLWVMTGMPGAWYADRTARAALEGAIRAAGAPWGSVTVQVAPEAAGVYYAYVFESGVLNRSRMRGAIGVIDAGYRDVNVALFNDGRYVSGESVPGGVVEALREIKKLIAATYGLELALHEVDEAVRAGSVRVEGRIRPLPDGSAQALQQGLNTILAAGRSLWPNGGRSLEAIVLGGGGAVALGPALSGEFPQLVVPRASLAPEMSTGELRQAIALAEPQVIGARGFASMAAIAMQTAQVAA